MINGTANHFVSCFVLWLELEIGTTRSFKYFNVLCMAFDSGVFVCIFFVGFICLLSKI